MTLESMNVTIVALFLILVVLTCRRLLGKSVEKSFHSSRMTRTRKVFLWFPRVDCNGRRRWLESVNVVEEYGWLDASLGWHFRRFEGDGGQRDKSGPQPDGSVWADGTCIQPVKGSKAEKDLLKRYERGDYTGD